MIQILRVDHRLLHGQVAFSWLKNLGSDCILIANNDVVNDELRKTTIKLAKPQDCKLVIKSIEDSIIAINSGITDKYKLFIVTENIKDAAKLIKNCKIKSLNLGGTKSTNETINISKAVNITNEEKEILDELLEIGIEIEIRQLPTDNKIMYK